MGISWSFIWDEQKISKWGFSKHTRQPSEIGDAGFRNRPQSLITRLVISGWFQVRHPTSWLIRHPNRQEMRRGKLLHKSLTFVSPYLHPISIPRMISNLGGLQGRRWGEVPLVSGLNDHRCRVYIATYGGFEHILPILNPNCTPSEPFKIPWLVNIYGLDLVHWGVEFHRIPNSKEV